jgi:hypothetical protein
MMLSGFIDRFGVVCMGLVRGMMSAWIARRDRQLGAVVCGVLAVGFALGALLVVHESGTEHAYISASACNMPNATDPVSSGTCARDDRTVETVTEIGSQTVIDQTSQRTGHTTGRTRTSTTVTLQPAD